MSTVVTKIVKVTPDQLIEIAQRLKSQAMDSAYPGEVVMTPLNDDITLVYQPESEFCKPLTRIGITSAPTVNGSDQV